MLYGAPRQSGLLATDLRAAVREAAERDRLSAAGNTAGTRRDLARATVRRSLLATVLRHVGRRSAAHAGAR